MNNMQYNYEQLKQLVRLYGNIQPANEMSLYPLLKTIEKHNGEHIKYMMSQLVFIFADYIDRAERANYTQ